MDNPQLPFLGAATGTPGGHHLLVHQQLSPKEWRNIKGTKAAVDAEWDQLDVIHAWDYSSVASLRDKQDEARQNPNITYHFGRVFPLCHRKHSELEAKYHKYTGRCVFGGNDVRDESGVLALF